MARAIDQSTARCSGATKAGAKVDRANTARLELAGATMDIDGRAVRLTPGMSASAEIKTDRRRLLEYLVSPILRYTREAGRER